MTEMSATEKKEIVAYNRVLVVILRWKRDPV